MNGFYKLIHKIEIEIDYKSVMSTINFPRIIRRCSPVLPIKNSKRMLIKCYMATLQK